MIASALSERYLREHVAIHCKASSGKLCKRALLRFVLPTHGHLAVEEVGREHVSETALPIQGHSVLGEPSAGNPERAI